MQTTPNQKSSDPQPLSLQSIMQAAIAGSRKQNFMGTASSVQMSTADRRSTDHLTNLLREVLKKSQSSVAPEPQSTSLPGTVTSAVHDSAPEHREDVADTTHQQQVHHQTSTIATHAVPSHLGSVKSQSLCVE